MMEIWIPHKLQLQAYYVVPCSRLIFDSQPNELDDTLLTLLHKTKINFFLSFFLTLCLWLGLTASRRNI